MIARRVPAWVALAVLLLFPLPRGEAAVPEARLDISATALRQGGTANVRISAPAAASEVRVRFAGRTWPVYPAGAGAWRTIIGTDPTTRPGRRGVLLEVVTGDGVRLAAERYITVTRVSFPSRYLSFDPQRQALLTPEAAERERRRVNEALRVLHPVPLWRGVLVLPIDAPVSSAYGVLSVYQGRVRGFHGGVDLSASEGRPVRAAAGGIVRLAEALPISGNAVLVDHGLGVVSSYLHLSQITVAVGQRVARSEVVGHVGSTGLATGPHLHWGLRANGIRVDPMLWTRR